MNIVRPRAPSHSFSDGPYGSFDSGPTPHAMPTKNKKAAPVNPY